MAGVAAGASVADGRPRSAGGGEVLTQNCPVSFKGVETGEAQMIAERCEKVTT